MDPFDLSDILMEYFEMYFVASQDLLDIYEVYITNSGFNIIQITKTYTNIVYLVEYDTGVVSDFQTEIDKKIVIVTHVQLLTILAKIATNITRFINKPKAIKYLEKILKINAYRKADIFGSWIIACKDYSICYDHFRMLDPMVTGGRKYSIVFGKNIKDIKFVTQKELLLFVK